MKKVFRPAFWCAQHPKAGQNTQQVISEYLRARPHFAPKLYPITTEIETLKNKFLFYSFKANTGNTNQKKKNSPDESDFLYLDLSKGSSS